MEPCKRHNMRFNHWSRLELFKCTDCGHREWRIAGLEWISLARHKEEIAGLEKRIAELEKQLAERVIVVNDLTRTEFMAMVEGEKK